MILTLNVGSSSIKWGIFDDSASPIEEGELKSIDQVGGLFTKVKGIRAIGHRIVFGGKLFSKPTPITPTVFKQLSQLTPFSPLHLPKELEMIQQCEEFNTPQIACFDTAFHQKMPSVQKHFPLPQSLYEEGVCRYGFHGLSYEYIMSHLNERAKGKKIVIAHLGNGASMVAVDDGKPIDTTMGLTPSGGIMMGTRSGDLDPGVLFYLMREKGWGVTQLEALIDTQSGLRGLSNTTHDVKELLKQRSTNKEADLALSLFCHLAKKSIGGLAAAMGGIDLLVFTGGIGEHAKEIRDEIISPLSFLIPKESVEVIPTKENLMIARHVQEVLP